MALGYFKFKGNRNYVHGTDMFMKMVENVSLFHESNPIKIDFSVNQMAHNDCDLIVEEINGLSLKPDKFVARLIIKKDGLTQRIWLSESENKIISRYEYDESKITISSIIYEQEIKSGLYGGNKTIDSIVALQKHLLSNLFPEINGKWIFTRLELTKFFDLEKYSSINIRLVKNLSNKLFKSKININGIDFGFIYFSLM